jgi:hypothetical protein
VLKKGEASGDEYLLTPAARWRGIKRPRNNQSREGAVSEPIDLKHLVERLRLDLADLSAESEEQSIQFQVDVIELELRVVAKREGGANGKVKFGVLEFGADGKASSEASHTIKLRLTPKGRGGGGVQVGR